MTSWTRFVDVRARLEKLWRSGDLLRAWHQPERLFPLRLSLKRPSGTQLIEQFGQARDWVRQWQEEARRHSLDMEWRMVNHRQLGRNRLPHAVMLESPEAACRLVGKVNQAVRYSALREQVLDAVPELSPWVESFPLTMLKLENEWPQLLAIIRWLRDNPRPGIYLRQLDTPGVHTKYIERRRRLLMQLLDLSLPASAIDESATGAKHFERRYGFASKPALIRFRILDQNCAVNGLSDLQIPVAHFAELCPEVETVFVVENDVTALAFPPRKAALVIFGQGYGIDRLLAPAAWLHQKRVFYWGDIDTHGFRILNQVRAILPHTRSLLMDRATLLAHKSLWGREPDLTRQPLDHLLPDEQALYMDLVESRLGDQVRLEQERISFSRLR